MPAIWINLRTFCERLEVALIPPADASDAAGTTTITTLTSFPW